MSTGDTRRINRGRGHSYLLDGEPVPTVTGILSDGVPKKALVDWAARTTAGYAVDHWDELAASTPSERLRTLERARWEQTRQAAARGTDIHQLAVAFADTGEADVPDDLAGHVDAYLRFIEDWHPEEHLVEVPVFHRRARYGGTLDLIATLADGQSWLLDWKTSASGIWPETAIQLAAYRYAEFWLDSDGTEHPMPEVDRAGAVWLRADGYDLIPVTADEQAFRLFRYAQQVASFTKDAREHYVGESLRSPSPQSTP